MPILTFDGVSRNVADHRFAQIDSGMRQIPAAILQAAGMPTVDSTELLGFMVSQLAFTEAGVYERLHQPRQYQQFIPVSFAAGEWAETIRYEMSDYAGKGKRHSGKGRDIPRVDVQYSDKSAPVVAGAIGYDYSMDELRKSAYLRRPLDQGRASAAMNVYEEHMNVVGLLGEAESGLTGLYNNSTIPVANLVGGTWSTKTPEEILADVNAQINQIWVQSNFTEMPDTILLPPTQYTLIASTPRSSTSDLTILQYVLMNNIAKHRGVDLKIMPAFDLGGAGVGATDRMLTYTKREDKLVFHIPLPLRFLAPQLEGLDVLIPGEYKYSGVEVRYPKSALYTDGL